MFFKKLFGNTNKKEFDEIIKSEVPEAANENEEELIAVITAAIAAALTKPVSGFRVVSFKKRGNWK